MPFGADLLTGADLNADDEDDSDLSHEDDSAGDELGHEHADDFTDDDDDDDMGDDVDEAAAGDDIATANHKRRDDKGLLPTEDKCVLICSLPPNSLSWCLLVCWCLVGLLLMVF